MIRSPGVKETITMAAEQGAQKQRILGRREDRNSCFLTEEVQMEAQVLLSSAITAARAVAGWRGVEGASSCSTRKHPILTVPYEHALLFSGSVGGGLR